MTVIKAGANIPSIYKKISYFVKSQLPSVFIDIESLIVPFLEAYYEWMEGDGGITYDIKRLLEIQDIDKTTESFIQYFMEEFLPSIPTNVIADKKLLLKMAKEIHSIKGTEGSFKFLFRILYNEDVTISYPKDDIFKTSDAVWVSNQVLRVSTFDPLVTELANRKIYGLESSASAIVERVQFIFSGTDMFANVYISNMNGEFKVDEIVTTVNNTESPPDIHCRIIGVSGSYTIAERGYGYIAGEYIPLNSLGDGRDFAAYVDSVGIDGEILKINIADAGVYYINSPPVPNISLLNGYGAVFNFNITSIIKEAGYFVDDSCMLSSTKRLQDGRLYQEFSYVLKSGVSISIFGDDVRRILHPAGLFMSNILQVFGNNGIALNNILFHIDNVDTINTLDDSNTGRKKFIWSTIQKSTIDPEQIDILANEVFVTIFKNSEIPLTNSDWIYVLPGYIDRYYFDEQYVYPRAVGSDITIILPEPEALLHDGGEYIMLDDGGVLFLDNAALLHNGGGNLF